MGIVDSSTWPSVLTNSGLCWTRRRHHGLYSLEISMGSQVIKLVVPEKAEELFAAVREFVFAGDVEP
ncbi:hypothetical protein ABZP36_025118 [Zizania latifolia]